MKNEFWKERMRKNRFAYDMGVHDVEYGEGHATVRLLMEEKHLNVNGVVHGGALLTLADTVAGAACVYLKEEITTLDLQHRFLKAVRAGDLVVAKAKILKCGRTTIVLDIRLYVEDVLVGYATSTYFRLGRKPKYLEEWESAHEAGRID